MTEIEELRAEMLELMNERIAGLQSRYQAQINERDLTIRDLQARLSNPRGVLPGVDRRYTSKGRLVTAADLLAEQSDV